MTKNGHNFPIHLNQDRLLHDGGMSSSASAPLLRNLDGSPVLSDTPPAQLFATAPAAPLAGVDVGRLLGAAGASSPARSASARAPSYARHHRDQVTKRRGTASFAKRPGARTEPLKVELEEMAAEYVTRKNKKVADARSISEIADALISNARLAARHNRALEISWHHPTRSSTATLTAPSRRLGAPRVAAGNVG